MKRIGIGLMVANCTAWVARERGGVAGLEYDDKRALDREMDVVQWQMLGWDGANWSPRRYAKRQVLQAWFIKVPGLPDKEIERHLLLLGGYDRHSVRKQGFRIDIDISSVPSSEWRLAQVTIQRVRG